MRLLGRDLQNIITLVWAFTTRMPSLRWLFLWDLKTISDSDWLSHEIETGLVRCCSWRHKTWVCLCLIIFTYLHRSGHGTSDVQIPAPCYRWVGQPPPGGVPPASRRHPTTPPDRPGWRRARSGSSDVRIHIRFCEALFKESRYSGGRDRTFLGSI